MKIQVGLAYVAAAAAMALGGCAITTSSRVPLPNGEEGYVVSCGSLAGCYKRAAKICGGRYTLIGNGKTSTPRATGTEGAIIVSNSSYYDFTIQCENQPAAVQQAEEPDGDVQRSRPVSSPHS